MKILFKIFAAVCLLIVVATVAVVVMVDPNDYRAQVQDQVKQSINRELELKGDISWSIFPTLGFETTDVYIKNPDGYNRENLLEIKHTSVAIDLIPLFSGEINIGKVTLDGFRFNLITKANGESNLDGMSDSSDEGSQDSADTSSGSSDNKLTKVDLGGVEITNAIFEIQDLKLNSTTMATIKHITLGKFELGKETSLSMAIEVVLGDALKGQLSLESTLLVNEDMSLIDLSNFKLNSEFTGQSLPGGSISSSFGSNIGYNLKTGLAKISDIEFSTGDLTLTGWASVQAKAKTKIRFNLAGNVWDLEPYMPKSSAETTEQAPTAEQEPDLSVLDTLDVKGDFSLAGLKASGLTIGEISSHIIVANGRAQIEPMKISMYQGNVEVTAMVAHANGKNHYKVTKKISGVQIRPLMKDLADMDLVSGATNLNITASGQGLTLTKLKSAMTAKGDFNISDGSLYGINIPQKIRSAKATLTGNSVSDDESQKTDFTSLLGKFDLAKGVFNNSSLTMASPLIRLNGAGTANLLTEVLDYKLGVSLVGSLEGQGSDDLSGLNIPLKVTGSFSDPKFGLDTSGALKAKLDQEKDQLKDKLKDKLKNKLGGLFGN